jgi:hypothetical protein
MTAATPVTRKRRRRTGWIIALLVVVVLLVVALFVGEGAARTYATDRIHDELATAFGLDADHPMDIDLGSGLFLAQAATSAIRSVDVAIDDVPLGDLTGSVDLRATGIPLDAARPVGTLTATATVDEQNVAKLGDYLSGVDLNSITLGDGTIDVAATVKALFLSVPVSAAIVPSAENGQLVFTPQSVSVSGRAVDVADLTSGPLGSLASKFLGAQSFCVAQYLPSAIVLDGVRVRSDDLVLEFSGRDVVLGGAGLSTKGTCPS